MLLATDSVSKSPCHDLTESGLHKPKAQQESVPSPELEVTFSSTLNSLPELVQVEPQQSTTPKPLTEPPPTEIHLGKQSTRTLDEEVFQHGEDATGFLKEKGQGNPLLNTEGNFDSGIYDTGSLGHDSLAALSCLGYEEPLSEQVKSLPEVKEDEHALQQKRSVLTTRQGMQTAGPEAPMECRNMASVPVVHDPETVIDAIEPESPLTTSESTLSGSIQTAATSERDCVAIDTDESQNQEVTTGINDDRKAATHSQARVMRSIAEHSYALVKYPFEYTAKYMMKPFAGWTGQKSGCGAAGPEVMGTSTDLTPHLEPDVESDHGSAELPGITGSSISGTDNAETPIDRQSAVIAESGEGLETSSANRKASTEISAVNTVSSTVSIMSVMVKAPYQLVKIPVDLTAGYAASIARWGWKKLWGGASGQGVESTSTAGESALEHGQERAPVMVSSSSGSASPEVDIPDLPLVRDGTAEEDSAESQE